MTVVVGYRAGQVGLSGLHLGVRIARTWGTSLTVATIVPKPWLTPSRARIDAEFELWADALAAESAKEAARFLDTVADGIEATYVHRAHGSVSGGLLEVIHQVDADVLVLGSLPSGGRGLGAPPAGGGVLIGSTADWLLHASTAPVAISPPDYRSHQGKLTRLTCAYSATPDAIDVVKRCFAFGQRFGVPVRVITFAVRGKTMYPPEVGLEVEGQVLQAWASQVRDILEGLKTDRIVGEDVALQVVTGRSWKEALAKADWQEGELLVLGTRPRGDIRRVFLGSRSTKIIRESPVPVLVLTG
ncbi:universal stress protein [Mycobacterium paraseoulense]|uniref:Universal stress protein n=1 Tax=Mycobacterium paraseoulense TaxID=590652 RepID=A0A1X0I4T8_9MYCO|nr:universal stress protein [Mycobacterium paraseoulense]MCV7396038.1 universal stress protein [Mycobacterium paraseoulense]ORB34306.1 universal stress protein [Mycobacterium paraseoulense]BBZ70815.1 universal stress protein [Mycobacterium paraseoulense]